MRKINSGIKKFLIAALLAPALGIILAGNVMASFFDAIDYDNGIIIHADNDGTHRNTEGIAFNVGDPGADTGYSEATVMSIWRDYVDINQTLEMHANIDMNGSTITDDGSVTILVDNDNGGAGAFIVQDSNGASATVTVINADAQNT